MGAEREEWMRVWRVGTHYGIHVYDGERPVATFHSAGDAAAAVEAVNAVSALKGASVADRSGWAIVSPETDRIIVSSVRSTREAALLCWWRDNEMDAQAFSARGFRCVPVGISAKAAPQPGADGQTKGEG